MSGDKRSQRRVTMCDEKIESMIKIMSRKCDMLGEIEGGKNGFKGEERLVGGRDDAGQSF